MISIIVPVYNVEEYLEECLESIRKQTYQDIEVILVNDGSTDGSQAICERYCQMDKRFRLINQKNQGQSVARNRGVKESLGEYIMFVDSDDVVSLGLLEQLMKYMSDGIDIVECNITEDIHCLNSEGKEIGVKELDSNEALYECFNHGVSWSPVAKLYRREIVEKVPFLENLIYEDFYTGIVSLKYIHKMRKINYIGYYYRYHTSSTMNQKYSEKNLDIFKVGEKLLEEFREDNWLPYVGNMLFLVGIGHFKKYNIRVGHPYYQLYIDEINKYAKIAKKSSDIFKSSKLLRWYSYSSKYFFILYYPLYLRYLDIRKKWRI
ncbi:glycosyltransferase family 2 protein [Streptococcus sp.]|uniref:glycosyltransferase family 2 protein n=1 Tax=Streptococcus sp. TaxID=1306 RepID=UPI0025B097FA|nr:glycosyltransferase family 2 protein [Streptococcus sp.]MDN3290771.1 glycosyltransferase family 2 protein [Streptococcus sp.]